MESSCDLEETPDCFNTSADDFIKWLLLLVVLMHARGSSLAVV